MAVNRCTGHTHLEDMMCVLLTGVYLVTLLVSAW